MELKDGVILKRYIFARFSKKECRILLKRAEIKHSKMKKIIFIAVVAMMVLFSSCGNKKTKIDPFASLTSMVDSVREQKTDTVQVEEKPVQTKADDSFNDFIYSFATDKKMQLTRILFPLPFYNKNVASKIDEKFWKHDPLYTSQDFYTLLFDKESDMDLSQKTNLNSVQFEWIYMKTGMVKKYYFERRDKIWMLEAINLHHIEGSENENFIEFFYRFANDSVFQSQRIAQPLEFVTTDPDDDFSILETTLELNQWYAFMPPIPKDRLTNINYGQNISEKSRYKVLAIKGIGNGFSNALYFQRYGNEWKLYKFEDLSD